MGRVHGSEAVCRMILDALIGIVKTVLLWIVNMFPNSTLTIESTSWEQYLINANQFVNMPLLVSLIGAFVVYEATIIIVRIVLWLWNTFYP